MKDIRFLGSDGDFLLLEDSEGQKFRLLLDQPLRSAIRNEVPQMLDQPRLSPREIQEEIRVGRSIEEIVQASGAPVDYVMKFAQPVLDELNHAVLNALTVRLEVPGDRFNDPTTREFGEIIKARLAASGAGIEKWSAMKAPEHGFYIYCEYDLGGRQMKATWLYDPKRLALIPENEAAVSLSSGDRIATPAPKLRPVQAPPTQFNTSLADTVELVREPTPPLPVQPEVISSTPPAISDTADLLEALRKKRSEREMLEDEPKIPQTDFLSVVPDIEEQESYAEEDFSQESPELAPETPPASKRGRASIPSWDEIVFGTKTED
ncbi:unannotated protein [freshwater metagenome]|jgi:hypothetical protein|uniref:Unannotated protein n=1 Tax=freshwater metagenome TaxID=449393 RepID=A0A6J6CJ36_9ZZZZ|nr:DUF3071 domain-containing protein [Actinomycetota bacterium]